MTSRNRTLQTLVGLLSAGTLGISVILAPSSSKAMPATPERDKAPEASAVGSGVAARLQAIRDAVSTVAEEGADTGSGDPNILKTWWRNGGWGWGNGGRGWGNGGWGNWHGWRRWQAKVPNASDFMSKTLAASAAPCIEMVVIQPTPFCNIACTYCYLPHRNARGVIAQETVRRAFAEIFASGFANPELTVVWHAGEPLVVPVNFYHMAFAAIEALRPPHIKVMHSFQTNGMLISEAWCDLIREWRVSALVHEYLRIR